MHEICKQVYLIGLSATVGCNDSVPFIMPTSWMTRRVDADVLGMGDTQRNGSRLHTLPLLYLLSDIYTMFYKGVS